MRFFGFVAAVLVICGCASGTTSEQDGTVASGSAASPSLPAASSTVDRQRMAPVELVSYRPECSDSTRPRLIDGQPSPADLEWAEEIGPAMGWEPGHAIRRVRFEGVLDRPAMNVLYDSPRYAGVAISAANPPFLGYTILVGDQPPEGDLQRLLCRIPQLEIRLGADHSENEIIDAMDRLFDGKYGGHETLVRGAGLDLDGNGIDVETTDAEAFEPIALQFEQEVGVRITEVRVQPPERTATVPIRARQIRVQPDDRTLWVIGDTCSASGAEVVEHDSRIEIELFATVRSGGGAQTLECASSFAEIVLEVPLNGRLIVDASTSRLIPLVVEQALDNTTWQLTATGDEPVGDDVLATVSFDGTALIVSDGCATVLGEVSWFGDDSFFVAERGAPPDVVCNASPPSLLLWFSPGEAFHVQRNADGTALTLESDKAALAFGRLD